MKKFSLKRDVILLFIFVISGWAQEPSYAISVSKPQGNPGDEIIVKFNMDKGTASKYTIERFYVDMDGLGQYRKRGNSVSANKWKGSNVANKWIATAGFHSIRVDFRWYETALGTADKRWISNVVNIQISGWEKQGGYKHPGLLTSSEELDVVRENVTTNPNHPMSHAYKDLLKLRYSRFSSFIYLSKLNYDSYPLDTVHISPNDRFDLNTMDYAGSSAYSHALQWVITKDQKHADKAISILNAWAAKCKATNYGVYQSLHATNSMGNWLEAAEILRHYKINGQGSGWSVADVQGYGAFVRRILYPLAMSWIGTTNPFNAQNQPIYVAYARMNLGIYMEDESMYESGHNLLFERSMYGNNGGYADWDGKKHSLVDLYGRKPISIYELTLAPDGTFMEINRDGGHMNMCKVATYKIAELLWHQGIDMYEMKIHNDQRPRLVQGVDWLYTHSDGVPFWNQRLGNNKGKGQITMGSQLKGLGVHEMAYNHYKYRLKDKYAIKSLNDVTISGRDGYIDKNGTFRRMGPGSTNYTETNIFTVLTHADVSKDLQTPIITNAKSTLMPKLSMMINGSKILMINYRGWDKNAQVKLYNPAGRVVQRISLAHGIRRFPLKSLSQGLYVAQFKADGANNIQKFIVR